MQTQSIVEQIAQVAHEANRAYCESIGDRTQRPWAESEEWQRLSAINGVKFVVQNPHAMPAETHHNWFTEKQNDGWTYGPEKDVNNKRHPCMVPYKELPEHQKVKDTVFRSIVLGLLNSGILQGT